MKRKWDGYDTIAIVLASLLLGWGVVVAHFIVKFW